MSIYLAFEPNICCLTLDSWFLVLFSYQLLINRYLRHSLTNHSDQEK